MTAIVGGLFGGLMLVIGSIAVLITIPCLRRKGIVKNYGIFIIVIKTILVRFNLFVMYMQVKVQSVAGRMRLLMSIQTVSSCKSTDRRMMET